VFLSLFGVATWSTFVARPTIADSLKKTSKLLLYRGAATEVLSALGDEMPRKRNPFLLGNWFDGYDNDIQYRVSLKAYVDAYDGLLAITQKVPMRRFMAYKKSNGDSWHYRWPCGCKRHLVGMSNRSSERKRLLFRKGRIIKAMVGPELGISGPNASLSTVSAHGLICRSFKTARMWLAFYRRDRLQALN